MSDLTPQRVLDEKNPAPKRRAVLAGRNGQNLTEAPRVM